MRALALGTVALLTIATVVFVFVELHASTSAPATTAAAAAPSPAAASSASAASSAAAASTASAVPSPRATASAPAAPSAGGPGGAAPAAPASADPLDQVVQGKSKREWRAFYAERQRRLMSDVDRYQQVIDRAVRGEEPDPNELTEAHDRIRELRERMRQEIEELAQIEATP